MPYFTSHVPGAPRGSFDGHLSSLAEQLLLCQDAKGDQCDSCGQLLAAEELINPKCQLTGTTPVLRPTRHLYLDLPALTPELQAYITRSSHAGGWSSNCVQVTSC